MRIAVRNTDLYKTAESLRRSGKSYSQIKNRLGLSKGTLSNWFSKKKWSKDIAIKIVEEYKLNNPEHMADMRKIRYVLMLKRYDDYRDSARLEYIKNRHNPLFTAGVSIYWGEGNKAEEGRVSVINTDPYMLQVTLNFYRHILKTPDIKLRAEVFIYKDIDPDFALDYWSKIPLIPKQQFIKTQLIPTKS